MNSFAKNRSKVISTLRDMKYQLEREGYVYSHGFKYFGMVIGGVKREDIEPDHRRAKAAGTALRLVSDQLDRLLRQSYESRIAKTKLGK